MKVRASKTYRTKGGEVKALDGVEFELPERGVVFVLGKSGSGKSTLLNLLSGLSDADEGSAIEVCGKDIVKCKGKELDGYRNSCCGFVFQEYNLIPELNVKENVMLSLELQGRKDNEKAVNDALDKVGLDGYGERKVTKLSGGQKQRVAIARAIVKNPRIVFADEPTGALDEATGKSIFELLREIGKDKLVVAVTHDREYAERYGDRIIELADGRIVRDSDAGYRAEEERESEFVKPRLPMKAAAKIGCANFKLHPIRLIATLLLSVIAFTFLGVALASAFNVYENIVYSAMVNDGVEYSAVNKHYPDSLLIVPVKRYEKVALDKTLGVGFGVVASGTVELDGYAENVYDSALPIGFAEIDEALAREYGFTVEGRLPQMRDELGLTAFSADIVNRLHFKKTDYKSIVGENVTAGGRVYTVSGIVDTHFRAEKYEALKTATASSGLSDEYELELATSVHGLMFVSDIDEYIDGGIEPRSCELRAQGRIPLDIVEIEHVRSARGAYLFDGKDGALVSASFLSLLLSGERCDIEYGGKRYFNFGELLVALADGDGADELISAYDRYKAEFAFPKSFTYRLSSQSYDFEYEVEIAGVCPSERDGVLYAPDALYSALYAEIGGEFDTVVVENSSAVKKYISDGATLRLYNRTVLNASNYKDTIAVMRNVFAVLAAVFAVFAVALLLNFLLQSFTDKLFTLGILKANGCNAVGMFKVFLCEALVVAAAVFLFACAATAVVCACLNAYFGIAFFGAYYFVFPALLAVLSGIAVLACLIPTLGVLRIGSPIGIIAENS